MPGASVIGAARMPQPAATLLDWGAFAGAVLALMTVDFLVFGRTPHMSFRVAMLRSLLCVAVGLGFAGFVYARMGSNASLLYLTAYVVEESLSVDNLFVFLVLFSYFGLSESRQQRVLFLGIAGAVAAGAGAFGMRVAYTSRREIDLAAAEPMQLDRLLLTSDVVSLHVPLTPETRHLIDKRALTRMKRSAYLINTARGPVVDEAALAWALQHHLLAGAALDVYEEEPAIHPDLLSLENVLLVPHLGSGTTETRTAMADLAADNVLAVLGGRPPLTPVP